MTDHVGGQWAGNFSCSECRQKRLTAAAFSRKMVERMRRGDVAEDKMRCKDCVAKGEEAERAAAKQKSGSGSSGGASSAAASSESLVCCACKTSRPASEYSNTQRRKGDRKGRCLGCVAEREEADRADAEAASAKRLADAQAAAKAPGAGGALGRLQAAAAECAAEAELVTGLKPLKGAGHRGGRKGGRGRGRGGGAGRGGRGRGAA